MGKATIGVYGLGTMGSALVLNMVESGFDVAVSNRDNDVVRAFPAKAEGLAGFVAAFTDLADFVAALAVPRTVLFMIPSGKPLDDMIEVIAPLLNEGDTIIDAGNSDFHLTRARSAALEARGLHFVGLGVSGGEAGARHGPSMMFGGTAQSWDAFAEVARTIAAKFEGSPCVDHLGPDGAGHFVKTVHNGIEYADMELIAEVVGLMRDGMGRDLTEIAQTFARWDEGPLKSYLVEISAKVLAATDPATGRPVIDVIDDQAGQKGTGRWTVIEAIRMGQSASTIEAAVAARAWSSEKAVRAAGGDAFGPRVERVDLTLADLEAAFTAARIVAYAQGFRILQAAGAEYGWPLDYARIAEIWRAGCIIRSALLDDIAGAFRGEVPEGQLHLAPAIAEMLTRCLPSLRKTVTAAMAAGHAMPALAGALSFLDAMRQPRGMASVIQGQRDFFGHHGFARIDADGVHHGPWWG